jgi:hypothetical protein
MPPCSQIRRGAIRLTTLLLIVASACICAKAQCTFTNGDFETGTLIGWTSYFRSNDIGNWYNYTGVVSPQTLHNISAPPQGSHAATTDHNAATTHELYQDFTLPAGQSGTLSFYVAYNNTWTSFITLNSLDYSNNQQIRIDLVRPTAPHESINAHDVYVKLFQTQPGDPLVLGPTLKTFDVSGFAGVTTRLRFAEAVGLNYFPFAVDNVCLSTTRVTMTRPTATGSAVKADFGGVNLTFPSVTVAGTTSLTQLDPATVQTSPPVGDTFIGPAYDLSTTATVTTPIHVCMFLPIVTDNTAFDHLRLLHKVAGVWVDLPSSSKDMVARELCGDVTSLSPFTAAVGSLAPTAAPSQISGRVTTADGSPLGGVVMQLNGSDSKRTITAVDGSYSFSVETGGLFTVTADRGNFSFAPHSRSVNALGNVTDATFTAIPDAAPTVNPLDTNLFFVRQQYLDFLSREPDAPGLEYWAVQLDSCGIDQTCLRQRRLDISAAFFASAEFQQTGSFIYRLYSAGLGRRLSYDEFAADRQQVVGGANLSASKASFASSFVARSEFQQRYSGDLTAESFVDALIASVRNDTDVDLSAARANLINRYSSGTALSESRSIVLTDLIEQTDFKQAVYDPSFVLMQYFGYLGRNADDRGYQFWLDVIHELAPENFRGIVCSFLSSTEYQQRFSPITTRSNAECGQ